MAKMCLCGRQIETEGQRMCDLCRATDGASVKALRRMSDWLYGREHPTEDDYDEAQQINDELDAQTEPIRQPQANSKWGRRTK